MAATGGEFRSPPCGSPCKSPFLPVSLKALSLVIFSLQRAGVVAAQLESEVRVLIIIGENLTIKDCKLNALMGIE